jgi:hypothetical protein
MARRVSDDEGRKAVVAFVFVEQISARWLVRREALYSL